MGTVTAKPKPAGRTNRVEQEILRCATIGETADFTTAKWNRIKRVSGRPVVSGQFLADLWLGMAAVRVHPTGIAIKGLHVEGSVVINYARIDANLRTPLASLHSTGCTFRGGIWLAHVRCESLSFHDCRIIDEVGTADEADGPSNASHDRSRFSAIVAMGAEIIGMVRIDRCEFAGEVALNNAVVDDEVLITDTHLAGGIALSGSELRAGLKLMRSTLRHDGVFSVCALGSVIGGEVLMLDCRMSGGVDFRLAQARPVQIIQSRIGGGGISLYEAQLDGRLVISGVRSSGPVSLYGTSMSSVRIADSIVNGMLDFRGSTTTGEFTIAQSRVRGGIYGQSSTVRGQMFIWKARLSADRTGENALDLSNAHLRKVDLIAVDIIGILLLVDAELASLSCTSVAILPPPSFTPETHSGHRICMTAARAKFSSDLQLAQLAACGEVDLREVDVGGVVQIKQCWLGNDTTAWSLELAQARVRSLVQLDDLVSPGAVSITGMQAHEVQFYQCLIGSGSARAVDTGIGIWAENVVVSRCIAFDGARGTGTGKCMVHGAVVLSAANIGSYIEIARLDIETEPPDERKSATALTLKEAKVGSSLHIGPVSRRANDEQPICFFKGAVVLDGLVIEQVTLGANLVVTAQGPAPTLPSERDNTFLTDHKHGVALSARNCVIGKRTVMAAGTLSGAIDLRDAQLGALTDGGGGAWSRAGAHHGQLLLDGAAYTGLDDDSSLSTEGDPGSTAQPQGAVARRLDWLAMQYPGGTPDAASFAPQPYEQLARHYAAMGDERARRQVLVRKRQIQRLHSGLGWIERAVSGLLGLTSDYGYSPGKASAATLILITLGAIAAWSLHAFGAIVPAAADDGSAVFSPLLYAIDVAVPFLDLGHDGDWRIDPGKLAPWPGKSLALGLAEALYRLAGLVMLSITVLTFSGILHEKE